MNSLVFLISVATCLLIVCGNIIKFYVLLLYLMTFLESFNSSRNFGGRFLDIFYVNHHVICTLDSKPFISFLAFFVLARITNTMLNKDSEKMDILSLFSGVMVNGDTPILPLYF